MVPVAMFAVALPHVASDALVVRVDVSAIAPAWASALPTVRAAAGNGLAPIAAAAWGAGALLLSLIHI